MRTNWKENERRAAAALGLATAEERDENGAVKRMEEQELDLLLNRTTKLGLRGYPGRSVVLEIQRTVNNSQHGHGWLTESQVFLDAPHMVAIRDYVAVLASSANGLSDVER